MEEEEFWTFNKINEVLKELGITPPPTVNIIDDEERKEKPYNSVGALFFEQGGVAFAGTAFVAAFGGYKNIVFTAAHNLVGKKGDSTNITFLPAMQSDGGAPFGTFHAISDRIDEAYIPHPSYSVESKFDAFDVGIVILKPRAIDGKEVGDVVPALDIQWGQVFEKENTITTLGYVGNKMWKTTGAFERIEDDSGQKVVIRKGDIAKGNSGGPWFYKDEIKVVGSTVSGDNEGDTDELTSLFYESEDATFRIIKLFLEVQEKIQKNRARKQQT